MKSSTHVYSPLFLVTVLLSTSLMASAQYRPTYHPPAPVYHPPAPAYHPPAPAYHPPAPAYHPPAPAYHPSAPSTPAYHPPSGGGSPSRPNPSAPVHSYTPGAPSGGNTSASRPSSGATTYTPHVYTPGASSASHTSGTASVGGESVRSANGVTTYTPHASTGGTSYSPSSPAAPHANTYTPATTPATPPAGHINTTTPPAPTVAGGSSLTPHPPSPVSPTGGSTHAVYSMPAPATGGKFGADSSRLSPASSQSVLHQVNTARGGLSGVNHRPIPSGQVAVHPDKSLTVTASNGRNFNLRPNGTLASYSGHGETATFRGDGRLASVHTPAMDIAHGPRGQRIIISERPDHGRLISTGPHRGYLERPVSYHGHDYYQRSYVHGDHRFTREYARYQYHGREFSNYVPRATYAPAFYGWAYYPWDSPAAYMWGWASSAWFACNAGFLDPSGSFQSGANWLTDYYLGQTLAESFDAGAQAGAASCSAGGGQNADEVAAGGDAQPAGDEMSATVVTPITPEIKQVIADEVKQQLAFENAAAAKPDQAPSLDGLPQVMVPNHLFVADQVQNVSTADGEQCALSAGDVIKLLDAPPDGATTANLAVLSSHMGDCPAGLTVSVPLEALQEMQNNFRAQLDSGLQALRDQQGKGGLPAAPIAAITPPPVPEDEPPPSDVNVQLDLDAQQQQADQAEDSVTQVAFASTPSAPQAH